MLPVEILKAMNSDSEALKLSKRCCQRQDNSQIEWNLILIIEMDYGVVLNYCERIKFKAKANEISS
jgi:hypothetical protein